MFELMSYWQGKLVSAVIVLLIVSCFQSYEANQKINRINEANSDDYRKPRLQTAPFVPLIIGIIILAVCLIVPLHVLEGE
jgi:hypothetical protein